MPYINKIKLGNITYDITDIDIKNTINKLNSNLDDRNAVSDLFKIADDGLNSKRIVQCNSNTINTPYTSGITSTTEGTAYINMSSNAYGTIVYIVSGTRNVFLAYKRNGAWGEWSELGEVKKLKDMTSSGGPYIGFTAPNFDPAIYINPLRNELTLRYRGDNGDEKYYYFTLNRVQ